MLKKDKSITKWVLLGLAFFLIFLCGVSLFFYDRVNHNLNAIESNDRVMAWLQCTSLVTKKHPTIKFKPHSNENVTKRDLTYVVSFYYSDAAHVNRIECWAGKVGTQWVVQLAP
jgi:hypothetical protein